MYDPSFMAPALIVSEKMTKNKKVYAADDADDDNDDAGKAVHMSRFCFAGETKNPIQCRKRGFIISPRERDKKTEDKRISDVKMKGKFR